LLVKYLKHKEIDFAKWDASICNAANSIIYPSSVYLNIVSPGWDAMILDNYDFVMPLTHKKKLGISYIFRPPLTQQLGIFSSKIPNKEVTQAFIDAIPDTFRFVEMPMNTGIAADISPYFSSLGITHHLDLQTTYENIKKGYSENNLRNIKKAIQNELAIELSTDYNILEGLVHSGGQIWVESISKRYMKDIINKLFQILEQSMAKLYVVRNKQGKILSAAVFSEYCGKLTYLFGISDQQGKESRSMFLMFDYIIQIHAGRNLVLDFEGSLIEGIARFFKGFGAVAIQYPKLKINKLPAGLKAFKR